MKSIKKILIPLDFSVHSQAVMNHAVDVAQKANAQLIILHVYSRPTVSKALEKYADLDIIKAMEQSKLNRLREKIKTSYNELLKATSNHEQVPIKFVFEKGTVVDKILEVSENENVNLILMGTRGVKGLAEFWGTKTAEISLKTTTPVLVLPYSRLVEKPKKIAFAYDLKSIPNFENLNLVKIFSSLYDAEIHIITIKSDNSLDDEEIKNQEQLVENFKEFHPIVKTHYNKDAEKGIFQYMENNGISMLVILHRHRSFLESIFRESLTAKITYHSDIPVLTLDERK
ncbi:MAG: universal stress protein [Cyclobacteriaceae bacterium]